MPTVLDTIVSRIQDGFGASKQLSILNADTDVQAPSIITTPLTVATLPAAPVAGQRAFVTDSNAASLTAGIGAVLAAGGSAHVPVVYDGTNWRIG
jgi:hypothetical protein